MSTMGGLSMPFRVTGGGLQMTSGVDKVAQNVRHLINTRIGERVMLHDYGSGIHVARDELNSRELTGFVRHELGRALRTYLPEIRVEGEIQVRAVDNRLFLSLKYRPVAQARLQELDIEL